ncbi:putative solute carrier family 35 member SLC35F1/F2/F6 [Medicago truncatula]|uniref:Putative solute carrier family 35 member SLC35F1/F2/F6 n=1 Tax=Medicago truncatula TaxID=3880 RepID=G7L198_MEDTR|nr:uncharacterized vacuolar membrane protein YML018C [Medicago truncatula]AES79154.1 solute carrier family 35 protein [Medicago truncatula]RHN45983.1 putative solute carrier family 35 member SLC35F1/F2/F6 [Medicago truncatula]
MVGSKDLDSKAWKWGLGLIYIIAVAIIWIAASFVVQSVVDAGVSPFLVTYICNSLFVVLIPIVEIGRYLEDSYGSLLFWKSDKSLKGRLGESEQAILLRDNEASGEVVESLVIDEVDGIVDRNDGSELLPSDDVVGGLVGRVGLVENVDQKGLDEKGRWTRCRVAKVSLLICPFWFFAQLTFNLSLKYTTVTSNTILSSASSLFTFLVSLALLGEKFAWLKLFSVLLCMGGTIIVSLGDSQSGLRTVASNPLLGDIFALSSAGLYAVYITLIRKKLNDDEGKNGEASMAQFLGFLGLFNVLLFLPVALILNFTKAEPFYMLTWKQLGLIIGKGLLDNVLSDYLWAKAVLLTSTTVATAGLTIQVPLAAIVDTITGHSPPFMNYLGAVAVMIGFAGINIPAEIFSKSTKTTAVELKNEDVNIRDEEHALPRTQDSAATLHSF